MLSKPVENLVVADMFSWSFLFDWPGASDVNDIVRRQIPVCVVIKTLYTKLKFAFYGPNEATSPLLLAQVSLLRIYF